MEQEYEELKPRGHVFAAMLDKLSRMLSMDDILYMMSQRMDIDKAKSMEMKVEDIIDGVKVTYTGHFEKVS